MKIAIIRQAIDEFVRGQRCNKDGVSYNLFDSFNRKRDIFHIKKMLNEFSKALLLLTSNGNKDEVGKQLLLIFDRIEGLRIDEKDADIPPLKFTVESMKAGHDGHLDATGGVTRAVYGEGIEMLIPAILTEIENNISNPANQTIDGFHTFVHELVHAMAVWTSVRLKKIGLFKKETVFEFTQGIRPNEFEKGIFDDLNEGFAEYITIKILKKIYSGTPFEAQIKGRYPNRVKFIEAVLGVFDKDEQQQVIELYLTGGGKDILEMFENVKDSKGQMLMDFLKDNYQFKHRGISACPIKGAPQYITDQEVLKEIKAFLADCTYIEDNDENEDG